MDAVRWVQRALFVGFKGAFGGEGGVGAVLGRFRGELEGAIWGVFEALLDPGAAPVRKFVFSDANFPFKNPRKTRGFRALEKT